MERSREIWKGAGRGKGHGERERTRERRKRSRDREGGNTQMIEQRELEGQERGGRIAG